MFLDYGKTSGRLKGLENQIEFTGAKAQFQRGPHRKALTARPGTRLRKTFRRKLQVGRRSADGMAMGFRWFLPDRKAGLNALVWKGFPGSSIDSAKTEVHGQRKSFGKNQEEKL
jgi:hypothetical protein